MCRPFLGILFVLVTLAGVPESCGATEIAGKWGLGFEAGDLITTRSEASIIRGRSASTAWILDLYFNGASADEDDTFRDPDTSFTRSGNQVSLSLNLGPRIRRYTRPEQLFSPYWDVFAHAIHSVSNDDGNGSSHYRTTGGELGVAFGAEYFFTRRPISFAAHTNLFTAQYVHQKRRQSFSGQSIVSIRDTFSSSLRIAPALQLRVYF